MAEEKRMGAATGLTRGAGGGGHFFWNFLGGPEDTGTTGNDEGDGRGQRRFALILIEHKRILAILIAIESENDRDLLLKVVF